MADLRYTVDVDTRGAQQSIGSLKNTLAGLGALFGSAFVFKEIANVSARFEDLRTSLSILYKDAQLGEQAFEQIKEFAKQSVFSVEDLTASVIKLKAAGLDPSIKQLRLFADVASVSADSVGALQAITDLYARTTAGGLGLEDLNRLGDRGIPVFTILAEKLGISRLEISKLGQSAEGAQIILRALEEGLSETFSGSSEQRANNLSQAFSNLGDALQGAADTFGEGGFNDALTQAVFSITAFIEKNNELIETLGAGFGATITFLVENLKYLAAIIGGVFTYATAGVILNIAGSVLQLADGFRKAATAGALLQGVTGVGLVKVAAGVTAALVIVDQIEEATSESSDAIKKLGEDLENLKNQGDAFQIPDGPLTQAPEVDAGATTDFRAQLEELKNKQDEVTKSAIDYFATYEEGVNALKLSVEQEGKLLKMTESQANVQRELNAFTQRYYNTINPLQREITELRAKDTQESRAQADEIEKQIGLITDLYNETLGGLRQELELREEIRQQQEASILLTDNHRKLQQDFNDMIREADNALQDLKLTPFQRELEGIRRSIDDKLAASIRKIKYLWEDGLITTDQYLAEIKILENEATKAFEKITETAKQQREYQRSFEYGWKEAFQSYQDNATNAAKKAGEMFNKVTKGMEDTIVNFVKTGKLEFKDLINDILEQLLRSQIQQLIAQTFSGFGGAGGGGSQLGRMFSGFFANGGMIPAGTFGVVGENGPELVSGPGTVTPLGAGGGNVTYNINAVDARSFKQLVASDPGFIHAVASQGARKVPVGR
jgi:lambda family phage tail tape measure protein